MKINHFYSTHQFNIPYKKNKSIKVEEFNQKELKNDKAFKNTSINVIARQEQIKSIVREQNAVTINEQTRLDKDNQHQEKVNLFFENMPSHTFKNWQSFMVQKIPVGISNDEWQELMQSSKSFFYEIAENYRIDNNIKEFSSADYDKVLELVREKKI